MAFSGKVALITGGGSGMGRLAARNLAAEGKLVAALDVNIDGLKETGDGHDGILTIPTDVTDPNSVESAVKRCEQDLGPIDRVYNAAAIMPTASCDAPAEASRGQRVAQGFRLGSAHRSPAGAGCDRGQPRKG
jgi:NAD(P)-dependent dehydrogenase (short-subunit alcohol dehydrogenase family)